MKRAYRLACLSLSRSLLSSHTPFLSNPPSLRSLQYPLNRLIQSLSHNPTPPSVESSFQGDERKTGLDFLKTAELLVKSQDTENIKKALDFGIKALSIFEKSDGGWPFQVARSLLLLGKVSFKLKRYSDSLDSLSASIEIFDSLERGKYSISEIGLLVIDVHSQIAKVKNSMGKRWEALVNFKRVVELKVRIFGPDNKEVGTAFGDLAEAYMFALKYNDALPFCLKSLEIRELELGANSLEVAKLRDQLSVIYTGLGQYTQALEQNEIAKSIFDSLNLVNESVHKEIDIANLLIMIGQLEEATKRLQKAISNVDIDSELKAFLLVSMAKSLFHQQKFGDSKRCLQISLEILDKKESTIPKRIAEAYADISMLFETMNEFEISISFYKRSLSIARQQEEMHHVEGSILARLGWLLLVTKRVDQAVPYLEMAIERLEGCFGKRHFGLGFAYKHLGQAYMETDQPEMAVRYLSYSKEIIEETFGLSHDDTIDVNQCLANAYGTMGSYKLAMEFQQRVVDAWEKRGADATEDLREAYRLLEQLKKKLEGSPHAVFPANSLPVMSPSRE
ncbi:protein KINESIN LIGHT CHAIN-RELATED 2-like isoform X1 [Carex rostrata]